MSRLASFKGPSSPYQSPVRAQRDSPPNTPSRVSETTHHRKVRTLLRELRSITQTWNDLVLADGLQSAQILVNTRTELDNTLTTLQSNSLPPIGIITPKIQLMEEKLVELDAFLLKLQKQFSKMVVVVDNLESVVYEAYKTKGWEWVHEEPLWNTWTLEKFATNIPDLLPTYHRSLYQMRELVLKLRSNDVPFETSRNILLTWAYQPLLQTDGWSDWEDLCSVEVDRWESVR